jgi:hypothetical protein
VCALRPKSSYFASALPAKSREISQPTWPRNRNDPAIRERDRVRFIRVLHSRYHISVAREVLNFKQTGALEAGAAKSVREENCWETASAPGHRHILAHRDTYYARRDESPIKALRTKLCELFL